MLELTSDVSGVHSSKDRATMLEASYIQLPECKKLLNSVTHQEHTVTYICRCDLIVEHTLYCDVQYCKCSQLFETKSLLYVYLIAFENNLFHGI